MSLKHLGYVLAHYTLRPVAYALSKPVGVVALAWGLVAGGAYFGYQCGVSNKPPEPLKSKAAVVQKSPLEKKVTDCKVTRKSGQLYHNGKALPDMDYCIEKR